MPTRFLFWHYFCFTFVLAVFDHYVLIILLLLIIYLIIIIIIIVVVMVTEVITINPI